jgi:hypothetical protein
VFGIAVYLDAQAWFGEGVNAYGTQTIATIGLDYALNRDQPDDSSKSGILYKLSGGVTGSFADWPLQWRRGTLTARMPPNFVTWRGDTKVIYSAGYQPSQVPFDLQMATAQLAVFLYRTGKMGGLFTTHEHLGAWDASWGLTPLMGAPILGSTRQLLSRYRDVAV